MVAHGVVTLLFTDIEGSTRLWEERPDWMSEALANHDALIRQAIETNHGYVFKTVGDAFCAAYERASDALATAEEIQRAFASEDGELKIRIAIHAGNCELRDNDYFGPPLNRVARMLSLAHGGQTLISDATRALVPASQWDMADLGSHRLRDLKEPERLWQLRIEGLPGDFPPILELESGKTNLPVESTTFIGRRKELDDLSKLLKVSRLITIHGPGGCGKTRLAVHVGADRMGEFPDGIWIAELGPITDPGLVANVVAAAMNLSQTAGMAMLPGLVERLKDKRLLLILDNCEHLMGGCVEIVTALLNACPGVKILATSRQLLGVRAEQAFRIQPLALPDGEITAAELERFESTALFLDRARLGVAGFEPSDSQAEAIVSVCQKLDGIPFAIELAAARLRHLSVEQLESRLDDRFRILSTTGVDVEPRMRTLRAMIDWSYRLLTEPEQRLFERLSVFAGGWTLDLAEKVCAADDAERAEVLDLTGSLVDKSLVTFSDDGCGRYSMLESVREFAAETLAERDDTPIYRRRLLEAMLHLVEQSAPKLEGDAEQDACYRNLEAELDNMRAALDFALLTDKVSALRLATASAPFWLARGTYEEGLKWLNELLASPVIEDHSLRAYGFSAAAMLAIYHAEVKRADAFAKQALVESEASESDDAKLRALVSMTWVSEELGSQEETEKLVQEGLELAKRLQSSWGLCMLLPVRGQMLVGVGSFGEASTCFAESLEIAERLCNRSMSSLAHYHLAGLAILREDWKAAGNHSRESIRIAEEAHSHSGIAHGVEMLARVEIATRNKKEAVKLMRQATKLLIEGGEQACLAHNLEGYARLAASEGNLEVAANLMGCSDAVIQRLEMTMLPIEGSLKAQTAARLKATFTDLTFHRNQGAQMALDAALRLAESL